VSLSKDSKDLKKRKRGGMSEASFMGRQLRH
jgi:hypothetical protein